MIDKATGLTKYIQAVHASANATAEFLTAQIHAEAQKNEWGNSATAAQVKFTGKGFAVEVPEDEQDNVDRLEYGTETTRPSAVIRRVGNRTQDAEKYFTGYVWHTLGKSL
jgi:hypothetical protein